MKIIAFLGAPGAGKTEAALVAKKMDIPTVVMGEVIREELKSRGLPYEDENAGRIANELREKEGMDVIARRCIPLIKDIEQKRVNKKVIVIDGIRGIAEVEAFKEEFGDVFQLIKIEAPLRLRYERIKSRGRGDDILSMKEFKNRAKREEGWGMKEAVEKAKKVIVIKNEGSLEEFKEKIKELLTRHL
jgi:dephospho-CoA kinase